MSAGSQDLGGHSGVTQAIAFTTGNWIDKRAILTYILQLETQVDIYWWNKVQDKEGKGQKAEGFCLLSSLLD